MADDVQIVKRTSFLEKGHQAFLTLRQWQEAGYPGRHPDDVRELFETHCMRCPIYDPNRRSIPIVGKRGMCSDTREVDGVKGCGCHVSPDASEWTNALAIPQKACPLGHFGAVAEIAE